MITRTLIEALGDDPITGMPVYVMEVNDSGSITWQIVMPLGKDRFLTLNANEPSGYWDVRICFYKDWHTLRNEWQKYRTSKLPDARIANVVYDVENRATNPIKQDNLDKPTVSPKEPWIATKDHNLRTVACKSMAQCYLDNKSSVLLRTFIHDGVITRQELLFDKWVFSVNGHLTPEKLREMAEDLDKISTSGGSIHSLRADGAMYLRTEPKILKHNELNELVDCSLPQSIKLPDTGNMFQVKGRITGALLNKAADQIEQNLREQTAKPTETPTPMNETAAKPKETTVISPELTTVDSHLAEGVLLKTYIQNNQIARQTLETKLWLIEMENNTLSPRWLLHIAAQIDKFYDNKSLAIPAICFDSAKPMFLYMYAKEPQKISYRFCSFTLPNNLTSNSLAYAANQIEQALKKPEATKEVVAVKQTEQVIKSVKEPEVAKVNKDDKTNASVIRNYLDASRSIVLETNIHNREISHQNLSGPGWCVNLENSLTAKALLEMSHTLSIAQPSYCWLNSINSILLHTESNGVQTIIKPGSPIALLSTISPYYLEIASYQLGLATNPVLQLGTEEQAIRYSLDDHGVVVLETIIKNQQITKQTLRTTKWTLDIENGLTPDKLIDLSNALYTFVNSNKRPHLTHFLRTGVYFVAYDTGEQKIVDHGTYFIMPQRLAVNRLLDAARHIGKFLKKPEIVVQSPWSTHIVTI